MSIALQAYDLRTETRLRLIFSNSLAAGAFGIPGPSYYSVTCTDGGGPAVTIRAAYLVANSPNVVELVLSEPIARGAFYQIKAEGVPATDLSTTPVPSVLTLRWGVSAPVTNVEPKRRNRERLLYGVDLIWNGIDFEETATGDLARVEGTANVTKALYRGVEANGLPWDYAYGGRARDFVDSPSVVAGTLKGQITAQILNDPRVESVRVTHEIDEEKTYLHAEPKLFSGESLQRVSIEVPNS